MATAVGTSPPLVPGFARSWQIAFDKCKTRLSDKEARELMQVTGYDQLMTSIAALQREHKRKPIAQAMSKIEPFLANLQAFGGVIDTCVQANPNPAALIWGGIKFVLELALRFAGAIERVTQGMVDIGQSLPRFQTYQKLFPNSERLNLALVDVYESVVLFCIETIKFLRSNSIRSIFRSIWSDYEKLLKDKMKRIEKQGRIVDVESQAAKMTVDTGRHDEIVRLLSQHPAKAEVVLPCHQIPYSQNLGFFGRGPLLDFCQATLSGNNTTGSQRRLALHGMGGVGKTSIALQYAYSEKSTRSAVLWFTADSATKLARRYVEIAEAIGLHQDQADAEADREAVQHWMVGTSEPWLVIFDNVNDPSILDGYLPTGGSGSILITSRDPESQYSLAVKGIKVKPFDSTEGRDFLLQELPGYDPSNEANVKDAESLTTHLGGLALGLKQMSSFIRESGCSITHLLELLRDKDQFKEVVADTTGFSKIGYDHTLGSAWEISMSQLGEQALNTLGLLSFLDPDGVQEMLIKDLSETAKRFPALFPQPSRVKMLQSISVLCRYGLIDQNLDSKLITIHRLVQTTCVHSMSADKQNALYDVAIMLLRKGHPQSQETSDTLFQFWSTCAAYAPHVLRLESLQQQWQLRTNMPTQLWELNFNSSWYLLETGSMAKALALAKHTEPVCNPTTREGELQLSYLLNTYACVSLQHKDDDAAMRDFKRSYEIRERFLGDQDVNSVAVRGNFMLVLLNQGKYDEVIATQLTYRDMIKTSLAYLPIRVKCPIYDHLAMAYLGLGQLQEAWNHMQMSIDLSKDELPMFSQGSGYDYFVQGNIRMAQGMLEDALRLHTIGLNIRKQVLGDHIQTAASCHRVGDVMARLQQNDSASDLFNECIRMYESLSLIGDFSKGGKARSLWRLSEVKRASGLEMEAAKYEEEAREIRQSLGYEPIQALKVEDFDVLLPQMDR